MTRSVGQPVGAAVRRAVAVAVSSCVLLLAGCVDVPTTGPAEPIEGQAPPCQNCVNVEVAPPAAGDEPKDIVAGYLRATSIYQPNYAVAKQYLSTAAAEKWSPEGGAQIYSGSLVASSKSTVVLDGRLEGSLGRDRSYTARHIARRWNFEVVREDGEWRINTPPPGLMIAEYSFSRFYTPYNLYFVGNATLVPDPIFLPNLPNQANVASVLMKALLNGPSGWLQPAVTSAIPAETALSVDSVTVQDGIAEVPLSDAVLPLNDQQRRLLAAQVIYTLKQATGIQKVLFTVNQKPFRVPYSDGGSFEVPVDSIPADVDPVPFVAGNELYAVRGRAVQLVSADAGSPDPRPVPGPLGAGKLAVDSLAVSAGNTDIAVVTDGRTALRAGPTTTGNPTLRLNQVTNLLRPQYSRYGELWAIGESEGQQRMWLSDGPRMKPVGAPILGGGKVTAFRISPDGSRMALVRTVGQRSELALARITRSDKVTVDGWRTLSTSQPNTPGINVIRDLGWLTPNNLLVLGAATNRAAMIPYEISSDASIITSPSEAKNWDAVELSILLGTGTSVIIDRSGQTYKDDGAQWLAFLGGCTTMAFPGA
jgi:hypothetical protein